jgi:uncharacterized protein with FMN-binding domain
MKLQVFSLSSHIMPLLAAVVMSFGLAGCGDPEEAASESEFNLTPLTNETSSEDDPNFIKADPEQVDTVVAEATQEKSVVETKPAKEPDQPEIVPEVERLPFEKEAEEVGEAPGDDDPKGKLEYKLKQLQVPPTWLADVTSAWDVENKPWKEGRIEIRRLLGKGDDASRREGIKLTWDYLIKEDIGNAHEYGMYLFLGNEPIWAVHVYREWVARTDHDYPPFFGVKALASLYADLGLFEDAETLLEKGIAMRPPKAEWVEMRQAEFHDAFGDLYSKWGKLDKAKASYKEAVRMYPLGKPPYGRHLLPRRAKKIEGKLRVLSLASFKGTTLNDGSYRETALGYSGDIKLTVKIDGGRIADIQAEHQEKIDQNACVIIPKRIIEKQSLQVDGISGATVTKDALMSGTLRALQQAGLE